MSYECRRRSGVLALHSEQEPDIKKQRHSWPLVIHKSVTVPVQVPTVIVRPGAVEAMV